jgi:transcriptional regulator with XRE-family HTH domain
VPLSPDEKKFLGRLGSNLKRARSKSTLTQQQIADSAELDIRTVQKIKAGELNILITTAARLKQALGCEWEDLLGR